jgi:hypothetical protein
LDYNVPQCRLFGFFWLELVELQFGCPYFFYICLMLFLVIGFSNKFSAGFIFPF